VEEEREKFYDFPVIGLMNIFSLHRSISFTSFPCGCSTKQYFQP